MTARFLRVGAGILAALLVAACSSAGALIGDNLPTWAGGLPPGTPPRQGEPGYDAYIKSIGGEQDPSNPKLAETAPPRPSPPAAPRTPAEPIDRPIH